MRESRTPGSVRGAGSNPCPYRDCDAAILNNGYLSQKAPSRQRMGRAVKRRLVASEGRRQKRIRSEFSWDWNSFAILALAVDMVR